MVKSPDAFRTISEVSEWLDTPAHVLRFWESKFTQIKPVKRAGGRRYYRPEDMALLGGIKTLLHEQGMTIKGVQKLLREQGVRHVAALGPQPLDAVGGYDEDMLEEEAEAPAPRDVPPMRIIPAAPLPEIPARAPQVAAEPLSRPAATPEPAPRFGFAPPASQEKAAAPVSAPAPAPPPRARRSLPDLPPDPVATPGLLSAILSRDPATLSRQAARLAPVAARLATLRDRLRASM
jgi:DNA-binding transcriptional MerR regulator